MAAQTADERILALNELRPLLASLAPAARGALQQTVDSLEAELRDDAAELRRLSSLASTDQVRQLIRGQLRAIENALGGDTGMDNDGDVADDEGTAEVEAAPPPPPATRAEGGAASTSASRPPPSASVPFPAPKGSTPATKKRSCSKPPKMEEPPGGLDPANWPELKRGDLPEHCFQFPHGPHREVPRCPWQSRAAWQLMEQRKPVILTHCPIAWPAVDTWDMEYLSAEMGEMPCTVYASSSRFFRYWDEEKNAAGYPFGGGEHTEKRLMRFCEFAAALADPAADGTSGGGAAGAEEHERRQLYLQTALVDGVGEGVKADFRGFDWAGLVATQQRLGWGELSSNLLLAGAAGHVTPAHYDEQQNLFAQLRGLKRVVLFPPDDFGCLYPFPLHHPCDRQAQVDLYAPDAARFPRFAHARPVEARLAPGELLYLPQYWWHHIENLSDGCVSLNFWFKDQSRPEKVELPLSGTQQLAMRRNIERFVAERTSPKRAQELLPLLAQPANPADVDDLKQVRKEVAGLLEHVMDLGTVGTWLAELAAGRFEVAKEIGLV
jgi:hypoxia-inducible factor 1-alpha inhibitor (HIF hydroxylase)